jgi:hypothetical protein
MALPRGDDETNQNWDCSGFHRHLPEARRNENCSSRMLVESVKQVGIFEHERKEKRNHKNGHRHPEAKPSNRNMNEAVQEKNQIETLTTRRFVGTMSFLISGSPSVSLSDSLIDTSSIISTSKSE